MTAEEFLNQLDSPTGKQLSATAFLDEEPVGTSIGQEISQIPAALKQSFGQPLEAMGETAQVAGFPAVATALKGAIQEPEGYVSAGQRFMEPQEGEFQIAGFAPQYAPRAVAEQTGQILMSIGSRIAGAVTLGGLGGLIGGGGGAAAGAAAGAFAGPALIEAAQVVGPVALERAKNNGYTEPTDKDMAYAIATAAGSGLLNAFGAKYLPGGEKAVGSFAKRLAASFIGEGIPEGLQSFTQQVGETIETEKGIQVNPKQAVGEALIGGGAGAAATTIAAPFTPEQIEEAKITESANKEAENLVIGNDNPQGKAVLANKQKLEQEIADIKQVLSVIESTDPIAQKLKLELKEKEAILAAAQGQVDSIVESADPVAEANRQQAELAKAIVASTKTEPAKPKSAIEQINEDKASLDERAKGFGADNARQFNAQNVLRGNLTEEESVLLSEISDLNNKTRGLGWRDAAQLSEEDFSTWSKPKFTDAPQSNEDLIDLGKLAAALDARGETDKSNKVKENISKSKRKSDWTIESWQERNEETITQDEVDSLNQENADWNDSIDNTLDFLERNTKSTVKPPLTVKQSLTVQPAPAAPVEQVVTPPVEVAPTIAEAAPVEPVVSQEFKDELEMSGVAYDGDTRYSVQQSSNGTFRAERIVNGKKEDIQIGLPDIETAQNVIFNSVGKEVPAITAETPAITTPEIQQQVPSGMSVEEAKAYLEERNKSTILGYAPEDIMAMQQGKRVARTIPPAPVTEQAAPAEAPAPEVAPAITATPQITQLESEYNAAKSKLDALGEEPRKPSSESKFFGAGGRSKADPAVVAKYDADVKAYNSYRRKYSVAKKAEVEAANNLFYARREAAAAPTPAVSETITEPAPAPTPATQEDVKARRYGKFLGENAPQAISEAKNALSVFKTTMLGKRGDSPFQAEPRLRELKNSISLFVANRLSVTNPKADEIAEQIILGKPNIVDKVTELKPIKAKELDDIGAPRSSITRFGYELDDKKTYRHPREGEGKPKLGQKGGVLIPTKEDFIQAGQNIYEAGMEFGAWAKQMIQRFGDAVREFLGEVWQAVSGAPAKLNELMGYLPKKGEAGALTVGKTGKLDRYTDRGTIVKLAIKQEKDTPKGILSETIKIIKQRVFDGDSTPSESATKKAWGLIERLQVTNPDSAGNAEAINQLTRETMQEVGVAEDATEGERQAFETIKQTVGATKLNNELFKYAIKLAGQGDNSMLNYLLNNELNVVGTSVKSRGDVGRTLGALEGLKSYIVQANEAEQAGFIQLAAQRFFNTTTPTEDQIAKIKKIFTAVNETKVNEEEAILDELTQVGEKVGTELVENINTQIDKASKPEVKDPMVAAITAMLKLGGTFTYRKTKNKIKAAVEKTIKGGITNYRDKLVEGAANGLETGFWKTLSSQENKPGPLGELDNAQNRELGNIVKSTLVSMKLQGTPPNTKMSIYEQVASILGEKPLSKDKTELADKKIREEINSKRESELKQTEDEEAQDAINLKYDEIEKAWDEAMSRQLDMPVGDAMLRRLIFNELKEANTSIKKLATLMNEDPTIGTSRQDRIVSAIINKIAGITFEGQNPADYAAFKEYLSNELESLVIGEQTKKRVVKTKEKVKANQALSELNKLAKIQSDTPNFPTSEKIANPVRDAVRNALKLNLNPMFDPKAAADIMRNWKKEFAAELQQLGVDEATALTLTDVVGRQIELDSVSRNLDSIDNAINKGALTGVINAIKNTPLADQQKPNWRYEVMRDYLRNAGLSATQAERIAKLMDISLQKRFAKAQEEAAASITKKLLKGIKPESNRGFTALIEAIRAQVLNPGSNVAMEFGRAMGWKGFTAEQLKTLNELDSKINDETITDAERAVALEGIKKIIDKVSLPTRVRDALSAFYIGQALGRFTVATVQVIDPIIFSAWDSAVASARNVTSPSQVMQIWSNYVSSLINAAREAAFSFKNDITRSGRLVDYLETQDRKLKRLNNDANNLWKSGKYAQAIKKYLFGYPEITSRVLKALDDAAFSLTEQNSLNLYMISAMNMAKIPKKKQLGTLRLIAQARQMDIADMRANGISKNDAIIYANERMKAEISNALSGLNLNSTEIIDSAINDSLSRIGKTRFKEQFSGEAETKDKGTLSFPFLKLYEKISDSIGREKGTEGEVMRIFQRILLGFPQIVARVANVAYGYTPLSLYRHLITGRYPLTYGTAIQRRKRFVEQVSGTAVLLPLLFLRSMSFDDDEEKPIRVVITGFGPVRSKDPEAYNQWNKKHNPGSLEIFIGDKRYAIDSKSAGPLKPMIEILGAIDDWEIRKFQDNAKMTKEELKKAQENAGLLGTLGQIAGSFALTAARRGPATGLMQGLIDFRRYPDDPIAAIAQEASFSLAPLIPILGFGVLKNTSDFLSEPIDTRTKEGAILNNLPIIGPMFGKPAINAFGQPIGDVEISEKIKKSIGIPITLVPVSSGDDQKLAKITLKNANGPEPLQRNWFDKKFETPLSDQEWRTVNEDYARSNRKLVLENYEELNGFDPEVYKTAISNVGTQSKYLALDNLDKSRKKP
jgi:hypothetical protein